MSPQAPDPTGQPAFPRGDPSLSNDPGHPTVVAMDVATLARCCHEETAHFLSRQPSRDAFCMELFRRAVVDREDAAWQAIYSAYTVLVRKWITTLGLAAQAGADADDLVNAAFERFWRAMDGPKFGQFSSLGALIQYLKMCTRCAVIDYQRARAVRSAEVLVSDCEDALRDMAADVDVETEALVASSEADLWATLRAVLGEPHDMLVARLSFVDGLTPRQIQALHSTAFASVGDVYRIKRNVLERLRRHSALRAYVEHS